MQAKATAASEQLHMGLRSLRFCVSPVMNWHPVQGAPLLSPRVSWDKTATNL